MLGLIEAEATTADDRGGYHDRQTEERHFVFLRQSKGAGVGVLRGLESPVERAEGDLEIDSVVWRGGLDDVVIFEERVLLGFRIKL